MRSAIFLTAALAVTAQAVTGQLGDAVPVSNNPVGTTYAAVLPTTGKVQGSISATAGPNGAGVAFTVNFSNLPTEGGPFLYHLHVEPVNSTGSCASTLAHLDPYIRGEDPVCDATQPATCQVGDLSGKYGKITSDPFTASYVDPYASTLSGIGAFFGNRSIVVHLSNKTRIACANFNLVNGTNTIPSNTSVVTSKPTSTQSFTGSAAGVAASLVSVLGGLAVFFL